MCIDETKLRNVFNSIIDDMCDKEGVIYTMRYLLEEGLDILDLKGLGFDEEDIKSLEEEK